MLLTVVLSLVMMASLFLMLYAAVALVQDKRLFTSAPKDIQAAVQPKAERLLFIHNILMQYNTAGPIFQPGFPYSFHLFMDGYRIPDSRNEAHPSPDRTQTAREGTRFSSANACRSPLNRPPVSGFSSGRRRRTRLRSPEIFSSKNELRNRFFAKIYHFCLFFGLTKRKKGIY